MLDVKGFMKISISDPPLFKLVLSPPLFCDTTANTATLTWKTTAICAVFSGYVLSIAHLSYRSANKSFFRVPWVSVGCCSVLTSSGSVSCLFSFRAKALGLITTTTFLMRNVTLRKRRPLCTKQVFDRMVEIEVRRIMVKTQ